MTCNKHYERFASILSMIEENGFSTADELRLSKNKELWDELYFAAQDFINYYALASKTSRNKKGEVIPGNADKVKYLIKNGVELCDIQMDILLHVMNKITYIMAQSPVAKKTFYTHKVVNNVVNDMLRKLPPVEVVPWDTPINSDTNEGGTILANVIGTYDNDPERLYFERETIQERMKELEARRAEKKKVILREVALLSKSKQPAKIMARLACTHLSIKPRQLAKLIVEKGAERAYAEIIFETAKRNGIELSEIRSIIAGRRLTPESVKADTNDPKAVAGQISRLVYRASKDLDE